MTDNSYRLSDTLGNRFSFNPRGFLTEMVFSEDHRIAYEYVEGFTDAFERAPYRIEPLGEEMIPFLNVKIPKRMKFSNSATGDSEILVFEPGGDIPGYVPQNPDDSSTRLVALMSDASFRRIDRNGHLRRGFCLHDRFGGPNRRHAERT